MQQVSETPLARLFIAITLNDDIRQTLKKILQRLSTLPLKIKWVSSENLHITLKFIGNIEYTYRDSIVQALKKQAKEFKPFSLHCQGLKLVPNTKYPRMIWGSISDPLYNTVKLQAAIDQELSLLGVNKEKKAYTPHITLARIKSNKNNRLLVKALIQWQEINMGKLFVDKLSLMQSFLKPSGPIYKELDIIELGKK